MHLCVLLYAVNVNHPVLRRWFNRPFNSGLGQICNNLVCRYNARLRGDRKISAVAKKQHGSVAQLVEQVPEEHRVGGSIPPRATKFKKPNPKRLGFFFCVYPVSLSGEAGCIKNHL
jgi:hypothetical protein